MASLEIAEVTVNGTTVKIQEMSWRMAEEYIKSGDKLLAGGNNTSRDEWTDRTISTVFDAIRRAGDDSWTIDKLKDEFGLRGIRKILDGLMELSGMKTVEQATTQGEGKAA